MVKILYQSPTAGKICTGEILLSDYILTQYINIAPFPTKITGSQSL